MIKDQNKFLLAIIICSFISLIFSSQIYASDFSGTAVKILNFRVDEALIKPDRATVRWETNIPASGMVYYKSTANESDEWYKLESTTVTTHHSAKLSELKSKTGYVVYVSASDDTGNTVKSDLQGFKTPPAIVVHSPSEGDILEAGKTYKIEFSYNAPIDRDPVNLEVSLTGLLGVAGAGTVYQFDDIKLYSASTSVSFNWQVPKDYSGFIYNTLFSISVLERGTNIKYGHSGRFTIKSDNRSPKLFVTPSKVYPEDKKEFNLKITDAKPGTEAVLYISSLGVSTSIGTVDKDGNLSAVVTPDIPPTNNRFYHWQVVVGKDKTNDVQIAVGNEHKPVSAPERKDESVPASGPRSTLDDKPENVGFDQKAEDRYFIMKIIVGQSLVFALVLLAIHYYMRKKNIHS